MISNMWKDTVAREQRAARKAANRLSREVVVLPPIAVLRSASYVTTTNTMVGKYTSSGVSKRVLDVDRGIEFPNAGHKPILKTTFFRTNGVM